MAVDMFIKITGITGEAQDKTHKNEIDVLAWSWGRSRFKVIGCCRNTSPFQSVICLLISPGWRTQCGAVRRRN
ncbi:hypothetical protein CKO12_00460 [Chromatium okenii]|nr:hypothetical protein [Chromatium okenii]